MNGVLYRLRSVDMLTDEELQAELAAPLRLRWTPPDAAGEEEPGAALDEGGVEGTPGLDDALPADAPGGVPDAPPVPAPAATPAPAVPPTPPPG